MPPQDVPNEPPRDQISSLDWDSFAQVIIKTIIQSPLDGWGKKLVESYVPAIVGQILAVLVRLQGTLGQALGEALGRIEQESDPLMAKAVAFALTDFFGVQISQADVEARQGVTRESGIGRKLGAAVMQGMFLALESGQPTSPEQGRRNAERMIGFNLSTALEGWMQGVLGTGYLAQWFPNWADLDDILQQTMGLGRVNRRVMQPLLDATIIDPFTEDVNRRFAGKTFTEAQLLEGLRWRALSQEDYFEGMARRGWTNAAAAKYDLIHHRKLSKEEIGDLVAAGKMDDSLATAALEALGYSSSISPVLLERMKAHELDEVNRRVGRIAEALFVKGRIEEADFRRASSAAGRTETELDVLAAALTMEREETPRLGRSAAEEAFETGLISLPELRDYYRAEGLPPRDVLILEQLAVAAKLRRDRREREEPAAPEEGRMLTPAQMERAFAAGLVGLGELRAYYLEAGFTAADADLLTRLAQAKKAG